MLWVLWLLELFIIFHMWFSVSARTSSEGSGKIGLLFPVNYTINLQPNTANGSQKNCEAKIFVN